MEEAREAVDSRAGLRRVLLLAGSGLLLVSAVACGRDGGVNTEGLAPLYGVSEETVSEESTQEISVFWPETAGSWPVVHLFPGASGDRANVSVMAETLAAQGLVVFVPDYRSSELVGPGPEAEHDLVCAWRYATSIADEFGGDLDLPVTLAGFDAGADLALEYGLSGDGSPDVSCFSASADPEVVVAIAACRKWRDERTSDWSNKQARVVMIAGSRDTFCPPDESEHAAAALQSAGFDAEFVEVGGGRHFDVVFEKDRGFGSQPDPSPFLPGHPAGLAVVQAIRDAIAAAG